MNSHTKLSWIVQCLEMNWLLFPVSIDMFHLNIILSLDIYPADDSDIGISTNTGQF